MSNNFTYALAGGHITCNQCQATSKRSRQRCKAPSMKGKLVCKTHGGRSTGHKTEAGRQRCAEAKTIHGRETREARTERSLASARLAVLEAVGFSIGLMSGSRTRGRRPDRMAEAYPELQTLLKQRFKFRGLWLRQCGNWYANISETLDWKKCSPRLQVRFLAVTTHLDSENSYLMTLFNALLLIKLQFYS